ncbi:hypothetical protein BDN70DRAFT_934446 [Pholiota conissans]|uniref:Uncharacterized protein n=1 Tax=Pholiota conissans TaxID=109636 RepID=A0A9P5YYT3_9AGAR|nr:hypothetical protein BDN70DRAFT_934446 [Pholiota conissans]
MSVIILDDRDLSIQYVAPGTSATLTFRGISVLGTIKAGDVQTSTYTLDEGESLPFTSTNEPGPRFSQQFSSILRSLLNDLHTLVITPIQGILLIDYITAQVPLSEMMLPPRNPPLSLRRRLVRSSPQTQTLTINAIGAAATITQNITTTETDANSESGPDGSTWRDNHYFLDNTYGLFALEGSDESEQVGWHMYLDNVVQLHPFT